MLDWLKATGRIFALFLGVFAVAAAAQAGPEDGRIVNGSGSISQSGTHTDIRQNSDFLATHWGSFNIAAHESVQAHQPDASSRLLIRVDGGGGATNIAGNYTSNGITILENRNGVQFSRGAIVNVGGLLATSSRISGVSGANWQLNGTGGAVVNHGQIAAGAGGVVLAAVRVENHGKITAQGGDVSLGAGSAFTVDFAGSLVGFEVKKAADGASVVHDGVIESQGGIVSLSAQEAQAVRTNVVSVGGVVKATRLERRGGVVYLSGGEQGIAEVSGDVQASDKIQTTGEYVVVKEGALLKAPEILVGGDFQGKGDVPTARRTLVERGALLDAGAEGRVIVWSDETTWFNGDISAPGGFAEVSGKETLASVNLAGIDVGELLLDPVSITIAATGTTTLTASPNGDIAATDSGGDLILGAADIGAYAGDLSLAATGAITVNVAITKTTGNLTLDAGGVLTIAANIRTSAGNLTLQAATISLTADVELGASGNTSLTGAISGNQDLTLRANGDVILNSNINIGTTGTLAFAALGVRLGSDIVLDVGTLTLSGVQGTINGSANNANFTVNASASLTIGTVNLGTGNLIVNNTSMNATTLSLPTTWTAGDITLTGAISSATDNLTILASGVLTLNDNINVGTGDLTLTGTGGIVLGADITLNAEDISLSGAINGRNGNRSFTAIATAVDPTDPSDRAGLSLSDASINTGTGDITLTADVIGAQRDVPGNPDLVLTGRNVTLTAPQGLSADDRILEINANNNITVVGNNIFTLGRELRLHADADGDGNGVISRGSIAIFVRGPSLSLRQAGEFDANLFNDDSEVGGSVSLRITTGVTQEIHPWMAALGTGFSLAGVDGVALNQITIPAALTRNGVIDLQAISILLSGASLSGTEVRLRVDTLRGNDTTPLAITATRGDITATTINNSDGMAGAGTPGLSSVTVLTLIQNSAFGSATPFTFVTGAGLTSLTSLTLQTAATAQTVQGWMVVDGRDLSLTSTGGDITIGGNINVGTADLTLRASGNILPGTSRPRLIADTVNFELTGADSAFTSRPFLGTSQIDTLTITTAADQDYRVWMAPPADTNRDLTIDSQGSISIGSTAINLGTGDLTLNADLGVRLTNTAGLTITAGDFTLFAGSLSLSRDGRIANVSQFVVNASGDITTTSISLAGARVELRADNGSIMTALSPDEGTSAVILADVLLMRQSVAFPDGLISRNSSRINRLVLRTTTAVDQPIYRWMQAAVVNSPGGNIERSFSLRGVDGVALASITTEAAADFGTTAINLRATAITLGGALTTTGTINLRATAITLGGALTGGVVALRTNTITGPGALAAIHATAGDITAITITSTGGAGEERPMLTGATSLSLEQTSAFGGRITLPFTFADTVIGTALTLSTRSEQLVRGWMIARDRNLTITSSGRVLVNTAIGAGNRNLGGGDLTLTSTGGAVRIFAGITTDGNLILIGGAGGINFNNREPKTLRGAAITISGNALSNRALTLTASGVLTLSGDINTGTSTLELSGGGGIALGSALTLTGGAITLTGAAMGTANLTITTSGTLTLNNNINLTNVFTGAVLTLALSGAGAIGDGSSTAVLTASTVRLRQVDAFAAAQSPFDFGNTGALVLVTDANQDVLDWMIASGRNLTVESTRRVSVLTEIVTSGGGARVLGTGALTLTSTGGVVRILANIATGGAITLRSTGGVVRILANIATGGAITLIGPGAISNGGRVGADRPRLTASTVSLTQGAAFAIRPFGFTAGSLALTTEAAQVVHNWMLVMGRNLAITSSDRVLVDAAIGAGNRNLGGGDLTLTSTGGAVRIFENISTTGNITLNGATGINFNNREAKTLSGAAITLSGVVVSNRDLTLDATTDALRVENNITLTGTSNLTLMSATVVRIFADISTGGDITLSGGTIGINFNNRGAKTLSGAAIMLTGAAVSNRDLTLIASGILTLNSDIIATGTSALSLSGSGGITLGSALATLSGGAITLRGAATGTADLTLTASGTLTIDNNITLMGDGLTLTLSGGGAISNGGNVGANRPALTASTVSFRQDAAFAAARPFGLIADSLEFTTTVNQDVHNWMIRENTNLTVTSSNRVRVLAAIGMDEQGRNLGNGSLTLTSTGRIVRIVADISTTGDVTLTASGILTINNNINIGTGALILEATSFDFGSSVDLAAGSHSFTPNMACNTGTSPSCTTITP